MTKKMKDNFISYLIFLFLYSIFYFYLEHYFWFINLYIISTYYLFVKISLQFFIPFYRFNISHIYWNMATKSRHYTCFFQLKQQFKAWNILFHLQTFIVRILDSSQISLYTIKAWDILAVKIKSHIICY